MVTLEGGDPVLRAQRSPRDGFEFIAGSISSKGRAALEPGRISWAIDGETYPVAEATDPRAAAGRPIDQPFFVTIVLTVGSGLSGPDGESTCPLTRQGVRDGPYAVFGFIRFEQRVQER